jgi:carbon-monoxide dehydrogenase medium subunit
MSDLFEGPGRSTLHAGQELLVGFTLPLRGPSEGSAFQRVMRPQGVAIAILNLGAWLRREGEHVADLRIAVGPAGPVPFRAHAAEAVLRGRRMDGGSLQAALDALLGEARFRTSPHRATAAYRREMAGVLLEDVLNLAWERAAELQVAG